MPNWKKVITSGSNASLNNVTASRLTLESSGSTIFDVVGSQGQLFSITDSLSGSLFAVSDISGLPILEVFSNDTVKIGSFNDEAITVSGSHTTIGGVLAIPGFTDVSASLAAAGVAGSSGTSGSSGSSGTSGSSGSSGTSGSSGSSGTSGSSGSSGTSGSSGSSGTSGSSGSSGTSGSSGSSGTSGSSGSSGTSGSSGSSGTSGSSGSSGTSGTSGSSGTSGDSLFAQTGSYYATTNDIQITGSNSLAGNYALKVTNTSGNNILNVENDGNVGLGLADPSYKLQVRADTNDNTDYPFRVENSGGTPLFRVRSDGYVMFGNLGESLAFDFTGGDRYLKFFNTSISAQGNTGITATGNITLDPASNILYLFRSADFDSIQFRRSTATKTSLPNDRGSEITFLREVNHQKAYGVIRGDDNANQPVPLYIFSGQHTSTSVTQPLILQNLPGGVSRGNVGIGLEDPQTNLHVSSSVSASTYYGDGSNLTGISSDPFPYTGSAVISGSLEVTGSISVTGNITTNTISTISTLLASDSATNVDTFATATYTGAIYDYTLVDTTVGARAGQFMVAQDNGSITFTDTSTKHLFDPTIPEITAQINGSNVEVQVTNGNGYTFKAFAKKL